MKKSQLSGEIKIEKDVPMPRMGHSGGNRPRKYPFPDMKVGDSFAVPAERGKLVESSAHQYGVRYGWKFSTRTVGDTRRVWRIA